MIILHKHKNEDNLIHIEPAKKAREWMTPHAYRCLPLSIANEIGWDVISPCDLEVKLFGDNTINGIEVDNGNDYFKSHFGCHTVTLQMRNYIWKSDNPDISLLIMPIPNSDHHDWRALTAIIEIEALDYPWFITIQFPPEYGKYKIKKGTPIARIIPISISLTQQNLIEQHISDELRVKENQLSKKRQNSGNEWLRFYHDNVKFKKVKVNGIAKRNT